MKVIILGLLVAAILVSACGSTAPSPVVAPSAVPAPIATEQSLPSPMPAMLTPWITPTLQATATATRLLTATPSPTVDLSSPPHLLSGTITGLDPGVSATFSLELWQTGEISQSWPPVWPGQLLPLPEHGTPVARFSVTNGPWQATGLALPAGLYILRPEAPSYVTLRTGLVLLLPGESIGFRYSDLDFEFLHPADAPVRLGVPLCATRPPYGGDIILPTGPAITPTPAFWPGTPPLFATPPLPLGSCYAGYLVPIAVASSGFLGQVQGLAPGQTATITIYAVSPAPQEMYILGPVPPDGSRQYASGQGPLAVVPTLAPGSVLTATMTVGNGPWGLIDPNLNGHKYVISIQSSGDTLWPKSYETVLLGSKALYGLESGVDFSVGTPRFSMTPEPTRTPVVITQPTVEEITLDQARHIPGFHLFEPAYLPAGFSLLRVVGTIGTTTSTDPMNPSAPPITSRSDDIGLEYGSHSGIQEFLGIGQRVCVPGVLPPGAVMAPAPDLHPETVKVHNSTATVNRYSSSPMGWVTPAPGPHEDITLEWWESNYCLSVSGSLSLEELTKIANSLR